MSKHYWPPLFLKTLLQISKFVVEPDHFCSSTMEPPWLRSLKLQAQAVGAFLILSSDSTQAGFAMRC
jgi:hypothetical protein